MMTENDRQKYLREEYINRINRVIDYIEKNINKELQLAELAQTANFPGFHFHRIFCALVGETLNQFIQRVRIEKAAVMLVNFPRELITGIAFDYGFSSSATFARAFKNHFRMSASTWRNKGNLSICKFRKTESNHGKPENKNKKGEVSPSFYISKEPLKFKGGLP